MLYPPQFHVVFMLSYYGVSKKKILLFTPFLWLILSAFLLQAEEVDEYSLKAALVMNFARFTDWPEGTFTPDSHFNLCLIASDGVIESFEPLSKKKIQKHPIKLIHIHPTHISKKECHLLFVTTLNPHDVPLIFSSLEDLPILTVSDITGFIKSGGIIQLETVDDKITFRVGLKMAKQKKLHMSALLLRHALSTDEEVEELEEYEDVEDMD